MKGQEKTRAQLQHELEQAQGLVARLEADSARPRDAEQRTHQVAESLLAAEHPTRPDPMIEVAYRRMLSVAEARAGQFAMVFCGILDPAMGTLAYCNVGHCPSLRLRAQNDVEAQELEVTGAPPASLRMRPGSSASPRSARATGWCSIPMASREPETSKANSLTRIG